MNHILIVLCIILVMIYFKDLKFTQLKKLGYNTVEGFKLFEFGRNKIENYQGKDNQVDENQDDVVDNKNTIKNEGDDYIREGSMGPRGFRGDIGQTGPRGPKGNTGPRGDRGAKGPPGSRGFRGERGDSGPVGDRGPRGFPGMQGPQGTFSENTCKMFGSNSSTNWVCPDTHPIYSGASMGDHNGNMKCNGGLAKNASCGDGKVYGNDAKAIAIVSGGKIVNCAIISGGHGYIKPPQIRFKGGGGTGAKAIAKVVDGKIVNLALIQGGSGYVEQPIIEIDSMPSDQGCNYCHLCCKKPADKNYLRPDQPGYTEPLDVQIQKNRDLIEQLDRKMRNSCKTGGTTGFVDPTTLTVEEAKQQAKAMIQKKDIRQELQSAYTNEIDKIKKEYGITEETKQKLKKLDKADPRVIGAERDWADTSADAVATQSSTSQNMKADFAIDSGKDTYSLTEKQKNAWWQVELPVNIEIRRIKIHNKTEKDAESILPFRVLIFNINGAVVGSQEFQQVSNPFFWDNVDLIGKAVRIQLLDEESLNISKVEVWGVESNTCKNYETLKNDAFKIRENGGVFLNKTISADEAEEYYIKYSKLLKSCRILPIKQEKTLKLDNNRKSKLFEEFIEEEKINRRRRVEKARKLLVRIEQQLEKERKVADLARKYDMDKPRSLYTQDFVMRIRKEADISNIETPMEKMTDAQKANCWDILKAYELKRTDQERRSKKQNSASAVPIKFLMFPDDRKKLDKLISMYENECYAKFPYARYQGTNI